MVTVTSQQLLHANNCDLSLSFYYREWYKYSKRKKVVKWLALMIKSDRKPKMQRGYSIYDLCMNIFYTNSGPLTTQKTVTSWRHDPIGRLPKIYDMQSRENNVIWNAGKVCARQYWVTSVIWIYTQPRGRRWRTQFYHF
jgi:hypothetical protein